MKFSPCPVFCNKNIICIDKLFLKTQQHFSIFGTCFDVSNIIISHNEYIKFTELSIYYMACGFSWYDGEYVLWGPETK